MRYRRSLEKMILRITLLFVSLMSFAAAGIAHQANTSRQPFTGVQKIPSVVSAAQAKPRKPLDSTTIPVLL
jgi:hypothetical protein